MATLPFTALKDVFSQQSALVQKKEVERRIVIIDRPYIRPIFRGKENKRVEFGAKVNNIRIYEISFIEPHFLRSLQQGREIKGVY